MTPSVSVVVASYNYGQYLAGALDSVLRQTMPSFEVWIVDDGSTDDTPRVVERYLEDPRVRYHRTDHVGQPAAKNVGIQLATAPLVAFLDADDLWLPDKLARQLELFAAEPELGVAYCRMTLIDAQGARMQFEQPPLARGWVLPAMFRDNFVCFSSSMVRKAVFDRVGPFNEQIPLAIDYDLWLRAAADYTFDYVDAPLVLYRTGHANLSQRTEERLGVALDIMNRFRSVHPAAGKLLPGEVSRAYAETYGHLALAQRDRSRRAALGSLIQAARWTPLDLAIWRGVLALALPEFARQALRTALRRPNWRVRRPVADAPST